MTDPTVQMPVVLAQQMRGYFRARTDAFSRQKADQLDALLSQPTPIAEPVSAAQGWDEGYEAGLSDGPRDVTLNPYTGDTPTASPPPRTT